MDLKRIIERTDNRPGKIFTLVVQALIIISLIDFSFETLPGIGPRTRALLKTVETMTIVVFTVEYLLRLVVADRRLRFIFSFYGIIDLLAILPYYLGLGIDLRSLRAFRLLRLIRVLKLSRFGVAGRRLGAAFRSIRDELVLFFCVTAILLYLSAMGIYYFEHHQQPEAFASVFDGLWWAVVSLTGVGYGDAIPMTVGGRIFTAVILFLGMGVVAVPTGLLAAALSRSRESGPGQSTNRSDEDEAA